MNDLDRSDLYTYILIKDVNINSCLHQQSTRRHCIYSSLYIH